MAEKVEPCRHVGKLNATYRLRLRLSLFCPLSRSERGAEAQDRMQPNLASQPPPRATTYRSPGYFKASRKSGRKLSSPATSPLRAEIRTVWPDFRPSWAYGTLPWSTRPLKGSVAGPKPLMIGVLFMPSRSAPGAPLNLSRTIRACRLLGFTGGPP